ncbi:MAG: hypothetical protein HYT65_01180 [Candidatus Yanofskybacteria bacterium]|nr:hypothetical protein [Candidatus Yanofskybacteria bacterium]
MKKFTTILTLVILIIFASSKYSLAHPSSGTGDDYNLPILSSSSPIDVLNRLINPLDYLNEITKKLPGLQNIGTTMPIPQQFSMQTLGVSGLSFDDLPSALKAIAILAINLFLIVIQTTASILKALLPFLS